MFPDAGRQKRELIPLNEMNGAFIKIKDDPRITRGGNDFRYKHRKRI